MNELQEMQDRIAQLEMRSKKQSVRQRLWAGVAILAIGLSVAAQKGNTQAQNQNTVVCRRLQIVDPENKVVGDVGVNNDGEGYVTLYNGDYKKTVSLGATTDTGAGAIWVYDENGQMMTTLSSKEGKGTVWTQK
ncbi:MAG TPA: hypothetical protein VF681_05335 [Abditibacteriaceae bacterium]|jgi:hypothetical protein